MKKLMLTIAMMAALTVCAATVNAGTNNLPANYKVAALAAVKDRLKDPDTVRTLRLSASRENPSAPAALDVPSK
jgi:hypothetical protein